MSDSLEKATPLELDMLIFQEKISQGDLQNISNFFNTSIFLIQVNFFTCILTVG